MNMLIPFNKSNATIPNLSTNASFIILFSLTTNDRDEIDKLRHIFQQYNLQLMRFTASKKNSFASLLARFSKNASLVAWTDQPISTANLEALSHILISKVILTAFFYEGQMWPVSRLKKISNPNLKSGAALNVKLLPLNVFWSSLQNLSF